MLIFVSFSRPQYSGCTSSDPASCNTVYFPFSRRPPAGTAVRAISADPSHLLYLSRPLSLAWTTLTLIARILVTTQKTCEGQARHIVSLASHRLRPWLQSSRVNSSLTIKLTMCQVFTSRFPGAALFKMANSVRLASACALQVVCVVLVWHLLWQLIRPALVLGCLSSRGPLGPALRSYHARVQ
jgi:hypothetical protein